jgi:hypothetical protein
MKTESQLITAKPTQRRKRITLADVEQIAFLTECRRMNFKEATAFLGIGYEVWRNWKDRAKNQPRYDDVLARVKASYLEGRLANIQDAETGKNGHRPDWRASKALLEIVDAARYGGQVAPPAQPQPVVSESTLKVWLSIARERRVTESNSAAQVVDVPAVKQLPESCGQQPSEQEQKPEARRVPDKLPRWWKPKNALPE